jgi:hypothetical protein
MAQRASARHWTVGLGWTVLVVAAAAALLVRSSERWHLDAGFLPDAVWVPVLVFGGFLAATRLARAAGAGGWRAPEIEHFRGLADPVVITDLAGRPLARNPAAEDEGPPEAGGACFLARWFDAPEACLYRLTREALANGAARAVETGPAGRLAATVTRLSRGRLLWRIERGTGERGPPGDPDGMACPGCASTPRAR